MKAVVEISVGILFFLSIWLFEDSFPYVREVNVYRAFCPTVRVDGKCLGEEEASGITTFKALPEQQTVLFWHGESAPDRLTSCAVRNEHNWSCKLGTSHKDEPTWMLTNGNFSEVNSHIAITPGAEFYQVPKWHWWLLKLTQSRSG